MSRADGASEVLVRPTEDDPVLAGLSGAVGGPVGRHSLSGWRTGVVVLLLLLTSITFAVGMASKQACANSDWLDEPERYTHMCYTDMPYLYWGRGLADGHWPYTSDPAVRAEFEVMEYPVGISYWAYGSAQVTRWLSGSPEPGSQRDFGPEMTLYVAVNAVGFSLVALATTWLLAGVHRRRPWDAAGFALAPALVLTGLVNWDLLAVVFVAGAAWAWARDRPVLTGVMLGLGTAVKLYPLFLFGAILVLCLRQRRWGALASSFAAMVLSWVVANLPAALSGPEQWKVFWTFNSDRAADLGSVWLVLQQIRGTWFEVSTVNLGSWIFLGVWCLGVLVLGLRAPVTPRFAQLGFLIVAGFLLVNKVYSPQYVLWLLPLAVLARPRWRDLLIWQAGEAVYFAAVWWYLGQHLLPAASENQVLYWVAIAVRILAQLWLVAVVVRDVLRPGHDPVAEERPAVSLSRPDAPVS